MSLGDTIPGGDCADDDGTRTPGNPELCGDTIDNDCSGTADCSDLSCGDSTYCDHDGDDISISAGDCNDANGDVWQSIQTYIDNDVDGYGFGAEVNLCTGEYNTIERNDDCNDAESTIHPDTAEICDGIDSNCNGMDDEGYSTFYYDADGDMYGDALTTTQACYAPANYVSDLEPGYCLLDREMKPGLAELCDGKDNDCDVATVESCPLTAYYCDADGDGSISATPSGECSTSNCVPQDCVRMQGTDCADGDAQIYPGQAEQCDGIDNNCAAGADEGVERTYYVDSDGDGYGNGDVIQLACSVPEGYVLDNTDCNDNPLAAGGSAWEDKIFFIDRDGDTAGSLETGVVCVDPADVTPDGYSLTSDDCNDNNFNLQTASRYFVDVDGDDYGVGLGEVFCPDSLDHYATQGGDCDDSRTGVNPGIVETSAAQCDGVDNDCDGSVDESLTFTYFQDEDSDNYGNPLRTSDACLQPDGYVGNADDCQPLVNGINPDALEVCDGQDNDCDGSIDFYSDGVSVCSADTYFCDADGDGHISQSVSGSGASLPNNCVRASSIMRTDCDDSTSAISPDDAEICGDGIDNNCDGQQDEGVTITYYLDADGDGHGSSTDNDYCPEIQPGDYVLTNDDCDDTNFNTFTRFPGFVDNDEDGIGAGGLRTICAESEERLPTGYSSTNTDCNDADGSVYENRLLYVDGDTDGFGTTATQTVCIDPTAAVPSGFSERNDDCLDDPADANAAAVNPGAAETCDGIDSNCNGIDY